MRRTVLFALSFAVVGSLACGKGTKSKPPAVSPGVDVAELVGPELAPDGPAYEGALQADAAFDGTNYLVVWTRRTATGDDVYGARVSASGEVLDSGGFAISALSTNETAPAVAFDGTNYLVVWEDHRLGSGNIFAARVAPSGTVLDPNGFPLDTDAAQQRTPAIAFDGTNYLVVWSDRRAGLRWDIYGVRVSPSGAVLDANAFVVVSVNNQQYSPAVAFDGTNYLVVWDDTRATVPQVFGARITPGGLVLDPAGIAISTGNVQSAPSVGFDGTNVTVVWQDARNSSQADVYAARVTPGGTVLDASGIAVASGGDAQRLPAIAADGRYLLVAWVDGDALAPTDVRGVRLDSSGTVLDSPAFPIAESTAARSVALASDRKGRVLALYDVVDATGVARLRARIVTNWATLGVVKSGRGGGTVSSSPAGIDCGGTCSAPFDGGTTVTLAAAPDADSGFAGWSGACSGTDPCAVIVDQAKSVTATFLPVYAVTVAMADATPGSVTSVPSGIDCGPTGSACSARFVEGTELRLVPNGSPGASLFGSWSGDCSGSEACTFIVDRPKSVTAKFLPAVSLTLIHSGPGAGVLTAAGMSCPVGSCAVDVAKGTTVTVTGSPDVASVLKYWGGCTSSFETSCSAAIVTSTPRYVSARFEPKVYTITAAPTGSGIGTISGAGLSCTTGGSQGCTANIDNPPFSTSYAVVTLRATPSAGSVFKSWTVCTAVADDPAACTLTVNGAKNVSAKFEPSTIMLRASTSGTGIGTISGSGLNCTTGSQEGCTAAVANPANSSAYSTVTLRATPQAGSVFKSWSGCTPPADDPAACTVAVTPTTVVSARFEPSTFSLNASTTGTGAGTISGGDLACATGSQAGCTAAVANPPNSSAYTTVTLRATPQDGSVFKSWSGCAAVAGDPAACTILVNGAKTVSARFEPSTFPLTGLPTGTGAGTISGSGLACTTGSPDGCTAAVGNPTNSVAYTTVTLRATPQAGSVFKSWSGCTVVDGDPAACTILVNSAKTVIARFEPSTIPLNASATGTGAGTISGAGLQCTTGSSEGCTAAVANPPNSTAYTTVTLRATPLDGSAFKSWIGCTAVPGDPAACTITVSAMKSVSARFEPSTLRLSSSTTGTGTGTVSGAGLACSTGFSDGCVVQVVNPANSADYTTVTLRGTPTGASVFKAWNGCTPVADDPAACTLLVTTPKTVSAMFEPSTFPVTVTSTGGGGGTVTGAGLSCTTGSPDGCTTAVANPGNSSAYNTVLLTAVADVTSVFRGWSGCVAFQNDPNSCMLSVNGAKVVTARFEPSVYALTVSLNGAGAVSGGGIDCTNGSSSGCSVLEANGATVTLTAIPDPGYILKSWVGCTPTGGNTCDVTMTAMKSVTAVFQPATFDLQISFFGAGSGNVTAGSVTCLSSAGTCTVPEANGSTVILTAAAGAGSTFAGWSGVCSGTGECSVLMYKMRYVWATFSSP